LIDKGVWSNENRDSKSWLLCNNRIEEIKSGVTKPALTPDANAKYLFYPKWLLI
jgi:hypothetical protein